ncbi:MAG: Asp23/Gls24 family envelope stress response protein [Chlamydiota bacterium]
MHDPLKLIDTKELELPETVFIRDIENKVFQAIVLQSLAQIDGVQTLEGNLFDHLLGDGLDGVKGIHVEQDQKTHSVNVRIEIGVAFGICIPRKAEEIQNKILEDISTLTELHVGKIHVIFKNLIPSKQSEVLEEILEKRTRAVSEGSMSLERYDELF